jgi:hypothetical protein
MSQSIDDSKVMAKETSRAAADSSDLFEEDVDFIKEDVQGRVPKPLVSGDSLSHSVLMTSH